MSPSTYVPFFLFLCVVTAVVVVVYGPVRSLATDYGRQRLFAARDRLFNLAAAGHIKFSDINYREFRRTINTCARYAHEVSVARILISYLLTPRQYRPRVTRMAYSAEQLTFSARRNDQARQEIKQIHDEVIKSLGIIFLGRSPIFFLALVVLAVFVIGISGLRTFCMRLHKDWKALLSAFQSPRRMVGGYAYARVFIYVLMLGSLVQASAEATETRPSLSIRA